ncbi:MAG: hypothetical protein NWE90_01525 [Candidatus Bathyarchaeota archaeon]|nr:hypothetical protein [Candidatus Bathyarchaeota archaeon]
MKIKKLQRLISILILVGIIVAIAPHLSKGIERSIPEEQNPTATRLLFVHEGYQVELEREWHLIIKAVNDNGTVDPTRDDLVEINLTSISYLKTRSEIEATTIRLQNGTATVHFIGHAQEIVRVTVTWKEGKSELKPAIVMLNVGVGGE